MGKKKGQKSKKESEAADTAEAEADTVETAAAVEGADESSAHEVGDKDDMVHAEEIGAAGAAEEPSTGAGGGFDDEGDKAATTHTGEHGDAVQGSEGAGADCAAVTYDIEGGGNDGCAFEDEVGEVEQHRVDPPPTFKTDLNQLEVIEYGIVNNLGPNRAVGFRRPLGEVLKFAANDLAVAG